MTPLPLLAEVRLPAGGGIDLYTFVWLVSSSLGTSLHVFLAWLLWRRRSKVASEQLFLLLVIAALAWHFGNLLAMAVDFIDPRRLAFLTRYCIMGAMLGLALTPPLLLQTLLRGLREREAGLPLAVEWLMLLASYAGAAHAMSRVASTPVDSGELSITMVMPAAVTPTLMLGFVLVLLASAGLTRRLIRADGGERTFGPTVIRGFLGIIGLVAGTYLSHLAGPTWLTGTLILAANFAMLLSCLVYSYSIHRLNYMELVLVKAILWAVLGLFVLFAYLFVIRPLGGALDARFAAKGADLDVRVLEALLVIMVVAATQPLKNQVQELVGSIVFQEKGDYRSLFRRLTRSVMAQSFIDPTSLLGYVGATLAREMHLAKVDILFFDDRPEGVELTYSNVTQLDIQLAPLIRPLRERAGAVTLQEVPDRDFRSAMRARDYETLIPIYEDSRLVGVYALGKRGLRRGLFSEEEQMLTLLGNQLTVAIGDTTVVRQKLEMGRKLYENEKLSSLGRLSASIAHEVKNPLSSIKAITQVMLEDLDADHPHRQDLGVIAGEIDRLDKVVNQLLRFARQRPSGPAPFSLVETLDNVLLMLGPPARKQRIAVEARMPAQLDLVGSRDAFTEVFFNLVDNAVQVLAGRAEPAPGRVEVRIDLLRADRILPEHLVEGTWIVGTGDDDEGARLRIEVSDDGPGIPAELRAQVFEPFFTTRETGTGLGLPIVSEKVSQLGGTIALVDTDQPGTTFRVEIPLAGRASEPELLQPSAATRSGRAGREAWRGTPVGTEGDR